MVPLAPLRVTAPDQERRMDIFSSMQTFGHEQLMFSHDPSVAWRLSAIRYQLSVISGAGEARWRPLSDADSC
jgi:hypothetical protein